jgi:DNA invertase Pin-like site-specific DNA recombinase
MKQLFAYIRVSDPKQGKGVSLDEQRSIIDAYARRIGVAITEWFVETRTAAKAGRPVFERMVKLVRARKSDGFIVHKLDRSTRNWYDWAGINDLLDDGVDIHVASDGVELRSNGSRLAADMEIVVAVHYIRNLRQEALKGIHGRLQQGILPNAAPVGYLDCGAGKPKAVDPVKGPIVAKLFELYVSGNYSLRQLTAEAERIGLRNRSGHAYSFQQIDDVLRNPFYTGVIRSRRYGLFAGKHEPLVRVELFKRVQAVLSGKYIRRAKSHTFLFRRFIHCKTCGRALSGSLQKGRVYYRCPMISCPTTSLREDAIDEAVREALRHVTLTDAEAPVLEDEITAYFADETALRESRLVALRQALAAANARLSRLTDLLLDGAINASAHDEKRSEMVLERQRIMQQIGALEAQNSDYRGLALKMFELLKSAETLYEMADASKKRQFLEIVFSNSTATRKSLEFAMHEPFATFAKRNAVNSGGQFYDTDRTCLVRVLAGSTWNCSPVTIDALQSIGADDDVKRAV